jgi:voltage-gated potassium channel Kch
VSLNGQTFFRYSNFRRVVADAAEAVAILTLLMGEGRTPTDPGQSGSLMQRALLDKPITPRRAAQLIAAASLTLTLVGGFAAWLLDRDGIGSFGDSLWWALQTVTTVGYGDVVPKGTVGRIIGALLMLNGIALLSVVTAAVTAMLVEQARRRHSGADKEVRDALERIESRLGEIESRLDK